MKTTLLKKLQICLNKRITKELVNQIKVSDYPIEYLCDDVCFTFKTHVYGEEKETVIKYPINWFQAFKEEWFPDFLIKKYPIIYKQHNIKTKIIYPTIRSNEPELKYHEVRSIKLDECL